MIIPEAPPVPNKSDLDKALKLMKDNKYPEMLKKINEDYLYWSDLKYKDYVKGLDVNAIWHLSRINRRFSAYNIQIGKDQEFRFEFNLTSQIQQKLHEFDLNLGGQLAGEKIIPRDDKVRYLLSSVMEEAIASSQIEGAVTTRKVAKEMLRSERKPRNRSEQMILNNYFTIKRIGELRTEKLTVDLILEIHKLVTYKTLDNIEDEGKFRLTNDVKVVDGITGEVVYHPPDYKSLNILMKNFCLLANKTNSKIFIHPIIRASVLHFLIGYIHPFTDGNGRTARAIFYWYLLSKGYWLMEYMSISRLIIKSKTQYAKANLHSELDANDITYFIKYKIRTIDQAFESLKAYISRKIKEKSQLYDLRRIKGLNDRQLHLLNIFLEDPEKIITIKEVQNRFGVVYQTARTDLIGLTEIELLESSVSGKKKLTYFRTEKFDKVLEGLCR